MGLRGVQPEAIEKRLKMLLYGVAGAGKSYAALSFPAPYVIDTEKGIENSQYLDLLKKSGGAIFQSSDFDEIMKEVYSLATEPHPYKTLVIDPLTTVYSELVDKAAHDPSEKDPTAYGRHYGVANAAMKRLLAMLLKLDMNVIVSSHAKNEYGNNMNVIGSTFDCYKKLDYLFDLVIEIQKMGTVRTGVVRKTRIATFDEFEEFEFSYKAIAEKYGADVLEKEAKVEPFATVEQIDEIFKLINDKEVPPFTVDKWFKKAEVTEFEQMPSRIIQACIDSLKK